MLERGCELNSVCGFDEIKIFQSQHDMELPEEYVCYLTQVSNGGDGPPEYGIGKLGEVASDMSAQQKENWLELKNVQKEFPYSEALTDDDFQDGTMRRKFLAQIERLWAPGKGD